MKTGDLRHRGLCGRRPVSDSRKAPRFVMCRRSCGTLCTCPPRCDNMQARLFSCRSPTLGGGTAHSERPSLKKITPANYRQDPHYGRIVKATEDLLRERGLVAPVELFVRMGLLSADSVEDWRRGRIPYLERVVRCNLSKASRILRILRLHAHDLDLKARPSVYTRWTKGPRTLLRFSKTGDRGVEDAYARHFLPQGEGGKSAPENS